MSDKSDLNALITNVLALLKEHDLNPKMAFLGLIVPKAEFNLLAKYYPVHPKSPDLMEIIQANDEQRFIIQIQPEKTLDDFPPGAILTPPPDF